MRWKKKKFTARTVAAGLAAGAVTAGLLVSDASPAGAAVDSPYKATDPQDTPARADVTKVKVRHSALLVLDARLRKGTDPRTHKAWTKGDSAVLWSIDDDGDKVAEYIAGFRNNGAGLVGVVVPDGGPQPPPLLCAATPQFHDGNGYRLTFPPNCVGTPTDGVRVRAFSIFDRKPYETGLGNDAFDTAPNHPKFTPVVKYTLS